MKLIQNSQIRVFKSGIPQKSSTVDIMSWIHSLGPRKRISSEMGLVFQRYKNFETLGNVFDMKLIQNSETRVFEPNWNPREPVAKWDRFCRDIRISKI